MNRSSFRNQCNGQELLAHFLTAMAGDDCLNCLTGYRIEYRVERSPNIFQTVRNLRDNDLFRWIGLRAYLGEAIQRMVVTDSFLSLAEWLIPQAKSLLWEKGGHPSEMDMMRTIEIWNFFGINSCWQQRAGHIRIDMARWTERPALLSQQLFDQVMIDGSLDLDHEVAMARIPEVILTDMRHRLKLRRNGSRWTATLLIPKGRPRKKTFAHHDDLFLDIYREYGDTWDQFLATT